jgi:hypothetical protein
MGFMEAVAVDGAALGLGVGLAVCEVQPATNTAARTASVINKTLALFFQKKPPLESYRQKYNIFHRNA